MVIKNINPSDRETYVKPEVEIVMFDTSDVITASGGNSFDGKEDEF